MCLGFPSEQDDIRSAVGVGGAYNNLTKTKKLELKKRTYDCPNIHFVDSLIEKVGDDSRAIISYGVNDCVPRFLEVLKRDLVIHLFSG